MIKNKLGIVGGGQLGMFICIAAKKIGLRTIVYSNNKNFSAKRFCDNFFLGSFSDKNKIEDFIESADFFTIETENIPNEFLRRIEYKKQLFPTRKTVEVTQNRLVEKNFLNNINQIKTTKYFEINNFEDLENSAKKFNYNCILKTQEFGYDGKGQFDIKKNNLSHFKNENLKNFILEEKINFKLELSVIAIGNGTQIIFYPPVQNTHKESILRETIYPAKISEKLVIDSLRISKAISEKLNLNGVLAIEMFVNKKDEILVNELAPRPHNSGHWTIDGCQFSQFDSLVSVIKSGELKDPKPFRSCKMINLIGNDYLNYKKLKKKFKLYDYNKEEIRENRKMGHYIVFD